MQESLKNGSYMNKDTPVLFRFNAIDDRESVKYLRESPSASLLRRLATTRRLYGLHCRRNKASKYGFATSLRLRNSKWHVAFSYGIALRYRWYDGHSSFGQSKLISAHRAQNLLVQTGSCD